MSASFETLNQIFLKKIKNRNKGAVSAAFFNGDERIRTADLHDDERKQIKRLLFHRRKTLCGDLM